MAATGIFTKWLGIWWKSGGELEYRVFEVGWTRGGWEEKLWSDYDRKFDLYVAEIKPELSKINC